MKSKSRLVRFAGWIGTTSLPRGLILVAVSCRGPLSVQVPWQDGVVATFQAAGAPAPITIDYPLDGTVFPPDIAAPTISWHDEGSADTWLIAASRASEPTVWKEVVTEKTFRPNAAEWITAQKSNEPVRISVLGVRRSDPHVLVSGAAITATTSPDSVGAPIFFRQVPLPFDFANHHTDQIRYSLGTVEGDKPPKVLLEGLPVCGNCHSFDRQGKTLGMDVDYANDKGSYVVTPLEPTTVLTPDKIITWSDYRRQDGELTFGLLSQISPDARYVMSTVKDRSIFVGLPDRIEYSQLFFPIRGILAYYDREKHDYHALPGANDRSLVQSNPNWSPDGKYLLFTRTTAYHSAKVDSSKGAILPIAAASEFLEGKRGFRFDIYKIPFNEGQGGVAEPLLGASNNGMSNYFPRVSPDGKWVVYTQSKNFMLLQPDSKLFIMPAEGGPPRAMRCNTANMNSWHSWSPNGRWLVFSSKLRGPYTQLWLTHVDENGQDSPPVFLENLASKDRAANIPEFLATAPDALLKVVDGFSAGGNYDYRVAKTLIHYDDLQAAATRLDRAIQIQPKDPEVWLERGAVLFRLGRTDEAFSAFRTATALSPKDYRGPYNLGVSQLEKGDVKDAADSFDLAARLSDKVPEVFFQRARANVALGSLAAARKDAHRAIALDPKAKALRKFDADIAQRLGDDAGAVSDLDEAIALDSEFGAAWVERSYSKLNLKDFAGADADFHKGTVLAPQDPLLPLVGSGLAFAKGDTAGGCQILRDAQTAGHPGARSGELEAALSAHCQ